MRAQVAGNQVIPLKPAQKGRNLTNKNATLCYGKPICLTAGNVSHATGNENV